MLGGAVLDGERGSIVGLCRLCCMAASMLKLLPWSLNLLSFGVLYALHLICRGKQRLHRWSVFAS